MEKYRTLYDDLVGCESSAITDAIRPYQSDNWFVIDLIGITISRQTPPSWGVGIGVLVSAIGAIHGNPLVLLVGLGTFAASLYAWYRVNAQTGT